MGEAIPSRNPYADAFPVENATASFWRTELHDIDEHRTTESLPEKCDVVIIGSGLAGASTAYYLLPENHSSSLSVVMLEARQVCSGATGRNGGHTKLAWNSLMAYLKDHGPAAVEEFINWQVAQIYAIKAVVEKENIDCDFTLRRSYSVITDEKLVEENVTLFRKWMNLGFDAAKHVDMIDPRYVEQTTRVKNGKAAFSTLAASFWPYKFVSALLAICLRRGLNLQTNTPVSSVSSRSDDAGYHTITTSRGAIKAKKILYATNGYTASLLPEYAFTIKPWKGTCSRSGFPDSSPVKPRPNLAFTTYNLFLGEDDVDYINPRPDGSVIVGGAGRTFKKNPHLYDGIWDDSTLIPQALPSFQTYLPRHYIDYDRPGSDVELKNVWTGIMGVTPDRLPHVGEVVGRESSGQWMMAGFNGGGMSMIFLLGKAMAQMLTGEKTFEETDVPLMFRTTRERMDGYKDQ